MKLYELSAGDEVWRYDKSIVVTFSGRRRVLSTSLYNGGVHEDFDFVFNHDMNPGAGMPCTLSAPTYEEHMAKLALSLGLDPDKGSGMGTAAWMETAAIVSESYEALTITAIATGGIDVNGGRVGDPASYFKPIRKEEGEPSGDAEEEARHPGTINIILYIDGDMKPGVIARALVTCTEAKTAALQELMAGSNYSMGIATGSGTDQTIVVANSDSPWYYDSAGKHSRAGELIGRVVKQAVKQALKNQTGLGPDRQYNALARLKRFGITADSLYRCYCEQGGKVPKYAAVDRIEAWAVAGDAVLRTSLQVHLLDQWQWGLIDGDDVVKGLGWLGMGKVCAGGSRPLEIDIKDMLKSMECRIVKDIFEDRQTGD